MKLSTHLSLLAAYSILVFSTLGATYALQPSSNGTILPRDQALSINKRSVCNQNSVEKCDNVVAGMNDRNHTWAACYFSGDYKWLQGDTRKAKCLTNLHFLQVDQCISDDGSSCELVGERSRILNAKKYWLKYQGLGEHAIHGEWSLAIQDALDYIENTHVYLDASEGKGLEIAYTGIKDEGVGYVTLRFRFGGDHQC